ncbi:MAG: hypothetical protein J6U69_02335 [Alistipes sp.]|nr:hypothetical protein [Alistipes sp.]
MKRMLVILTTLSIVSCNSAIHETEYEVRFTDGTTTSVVGYSVTTIKNHYVVQSVNNNSIFDKSKVVGVYPKEIGYIWNPIKE